MPSEPVEDFFEIWKHPPSLEDGFPEEGKLCLTDQKLVELSGSNPQGWPAHVKECEHCRGVVYYLRSRGQEPGRIYHLLREQEMASEVQHYPRPSVLSQVWSYFSFGQPKWAVPALAASLLLMFLGWVISNRQVSPDEGGRAVASLEEDVYGKTAQMLKASSEKLNDPDMSPQEKRLYLQSFSKNVPEINSKLAALTRGNLDPARRAELANLVVTYNGGVAVLREKLSSQANAPPVQPPEITPTADSDLVVRVYTTVYDSVSNKSPVEGDKRPTEAETARAVQVGKEQVDVVAIAGNEEAVAVEVRDLKPDRSPEETRALQESLKQSLSAFNQRQVTLRLTPASAFAHQQ